MKHIKYIKEYNTEPLYKEIGREESVNLKHDRWININDVAYQAIKEYLWNHNSDDIEYYQLELTKDKLRNITYIRITTDYDYIYIYQLTDEYFIISIDSDYYLCDEVLGVIEFLKDQY